MVSKKRIKEAMIIMSSVVMADRVVAKKDGTYELRFGFFYTHGRTSEKMANRVKGVMAEAVTIVNHEEVYRPWPKDSYWSVAIQVADPRRLIEMAEGFCEEWDCDWAEIVRDIERDVQVYFTDTKLHRT